MNRNKIKKTYKPPTDFLKYNSKVLTPYNIEERERATARLINISKKLKESENESVNSMHNNPENQNNQSSEEINKLTQERDEYLAIARKERADFENYKKRVIKEKENAKRDNLAHFIQDFAIVLNDLDRILLESEKQHSYEVLKDGVKLLRDNLWKTLNKNDVKIIEAKGKKFDPNFHEAIATMPVSDQEDNIVVEVFENGYHINDYVLKPARVIVSVKTE